MGLCLECGYQSDAKTRSISGGKIALFTKGAGVDNMKIGKSTNRKFWISILATLVIISGSRNSGAIGADATKLNAELENLRLAGKSLEQDQPAAFARLHAIIAGITDSAHVANPSNALLMVGAVVNIKRGDSFDFPVTMTNVSNSPVVLQGDFTIPSGFTLVSIIPSPAVIGAGKNLAANISIGRFIIYGVNTTPIPAGIVAVARFSTTGSPLTGLVPIAIKDPVAAGNTTAMPVVTVSGFVKVTP